VSLQPRLIVDKNDRMKAFLNHALPQQGMTLVELVVVLAIAAIFLSYGVPSYQSVTAQDRMAGEINGLSGAIELTRSAAVKQGVPVTICASANPTANPPSCSGSSSWATGWIVFTDIANNRTYSTASGDTLFRVQAGLQGGDSLTGTAGSPGAFAGNLSALTFNRMGGTANFGGLSLHDGTNRLNWRRCLVVSLVGTTQLNTQVRNPGVCP
jgi:type IV fimbrial biogenesis protein FimT